MFRANTVYEGEYLLGTSIARPLIAKRMIEIAVNESANTIAHGATGKGNDQIRFELGAYALKPDIQVIAPWRIWDFNSRTDLINYCNNEGITVDKTSEDDPLYSTDENILHTSYEGGQLEDANKPPNEKMWLRTKSIKEAPEDPSLIKISFQSGDPIAQTSLAIMYQLGQGVQINHPKAFALLQNAARKGYVPAQTSLGSFYEKGVGVPLDNVRAYMWYYIASSSDAVSRTLLEIMKQTVNSDQINTAMLLAEECVNSNFVKC
jgi:hypothetical protein